MTPLQPQITTQATGISRRTPQQIAAAEFAASLGAPRRESGAPVRAIFCADEDTVSTPMARLLSSGAAGGGGRGGQVRLKLYLSLLWVCAKSPYSVSRTARAWAALIGLQDPEVRGARRIHQAIADLEQLGLVSVVPRAGHASTITVLNESGNGSAYTPPADSYSALQASKASRVVLDRHLYVKLPSRFWTDGLIAEMTAAEIAMMLVLLTESRGKSKYVWFSPAVVERRFGLSPTTVRKGLQGLRDQGLVKTKKKALSEDGTYISTLRYRNMHKLDMTATFGQVP